MPLGGLHDISLHMYDNHLWLHDVTSTVVEQLRNSKREANVA